MPQALRQVQEDAGAREVPRSQPYLPDSTLAPSHATGSEALVPLEMI